MPPLVEQSFVKALFHGVIAEDIIFPFPELPSEDRDNTAMILDSVRRFFAANVDSARIDREREIPETVLEGLKALGLYGLQVPTEYDGIGLSTTAFTRIMQEVGGLDPAIAVSLGAHQSIGLRGLLAFGTPEQKRRYLPRLATGEHTAAFALTEPSAGSDAAAIKTRAEPTPDGAAFVLNGSKIWTTNGGFADVITVFARTSAPGEGHKPKITAFLVERGMGVKSGPNLNKLGIRGASTTELVFEDVRVPRENVLDEVGRGFKVAMEVLNSGRLGLAAGCVGLSAHLIQLAIGRAQERRAFGRNIGDFGMIQDKIATMLADTYALESATYLTAGIVDNKVADYSLESTICKIMGSETAWRVVNEALQISAGIGYMADYPYERLLRDARVFMIFEGTNEILRAFLALSGVAGPGKAIAEVVKAMHEPRSGFGTLADFAVRKARGVLSRERMARAHPRIAREAAIFEGHTAELARTVESVLRKHGRDIAEMQHVQRRIADMTVDLYAIAACLSRTTRAIERRGEAGARREIDLTQIFVASAHHRLRRSVADFAGNDDELRRAVAGRAYADRAYPFDIL